MSEAAPQELLNIFDPEWYLAHYSDIAHAKVDPFEHYRVFGWKEGRWPCCLTSVTLDNRIWANQETKESLQELERIANDNKSTQRGLACWFLCRWFASWGDWDRAIVYVEGMLKDQMIRLFVPHQGPFLLAFTIYFQSKQIALAESVISNKNWPESTNKILAMSMLTKGNEKLRLINRVFSENGLLEISLDSTPNIDDISTNTENDNKKPKFWDPLVSIIIPCFNAENTISTAIQSLLNQTYAKLEIIVVDDASNDKTASVLRNWVKKDSRVKYIRMPNNSGAYAARNKGLTVSKGGLITTHDADDWSHPQKIEKQVLSLKNNRKLKAVLSHWVRTTPNLEFERWRMEEGWIYRNVSSLMFRRSVFKSIGFWDTVSVNADTEYYLRIQKKYGVASMGEVLPNIPLSFGRVDSGSLTQTSATHLRTQFNGVRKDYIDSALRWQQETKKLYIPQHGLRKFTSPPLICRGLVAERQDNLARVLSENKLFDTDWYIDAYPDIAKAKVDPLKHFIKFGIDEGRDFHPCLSLSGLATTSGQSNFEALSKWASELPPRFPLLSITGVAADTDNRNVLMVGHLAGKELFGAERSFLDCVRMLHSKGNNITVILPNATNRSYINELLEYVCDIYFTPLPWWRNGRQEIAKVTSQISSIINLAKPSVVYVNTLTLWEPFVAARSHNIETIMHVRELPDHDVDLCVRLEATPDQIKKHVDANSDRIIANSLVTSKFIDLEGKTTVVYNSVSSQLFNVPLKDNTTECLNVAMLSSNTSKKGIDDLFAVAEIVANTTENICFYIFGPETPLLKKLLEDYQGNNISYCGYVDDPATAFKNMDIVLNLSKFQESFGRTVVEGMACGCIPIGYEWGALPETITPSVGFLIPLGDVESLAKRLLSIQDKPKRIQEMKYAAREMASKKFSEDEIATQLNRVI